MANADLRSFVEDALRSLDPSIDLDAGSPAQTRFIEPLLTRLGTDPFETDITAFVTDRFRQEYPAIYAEDPGVVRDLFINPLITLLEPFKRETLGIKVNQSLKDPSLLSVDDAEALASNLSVEPSQGRKSVGVVRAYFPNPISTEFPTVSRFFTAGGLNFYPVIPLGVTAEEMTFNRSGSLFFADVPLIAEKEGAEYSVGANEIIGVEGVFGVVKVTNLRKFSGGAVKTDKETFVTNARVGLTERSLVAPRGAIARITQEFRSEVRAVQVIGARDAEMQRDLLVAHSPGHAWLTGRVSLYKGLAYVRVRTYDGAKSDRPQAGDEVYVYLPKSAYPDLLDAARFVRLTIEETMFGPMSESSYEFSYLIRYTGALPSVLDPETVHSFEGGVSRKGTIQIDALPSVKLASSLQARDREVHLYGHTDIYIRPVLQSTSTAVLDSLTETRSFVERTGLATVAGSNLVQDPGVSDFAALGIAQGDLLVVETGEDAGTYQILKATGSSLHLAVALVATGAVRYRIVRDIDVDLFDPKIRKFPFGDSDASDLRTVLGSPLFELGTHDLLEYGAKVGDTLRVLSGTEPGDYTITGFDTTLGGRGVYVDRAANATQDLLRYEVFAPLSPIERPLVRIKELLVLDSSKQSTAITIPPAEPVGSVPVGDFTSAQVLGASARKSGYVLPDLGPLADYIGNNTSAPGAGGQYSQDFDIAEGVFKAVQFADGSYNELVFRDDAKGACSYFVATCEDGPKPPIEPKQGDCLTLKSGPNKGSYLIRAVHKYRYKVADGGDRWVYFVGIYGKFPVDPLSQLIEFLKDAPGSIDIGLTLPNPISFPSFFTDWYAGLASKLRTALTNFGVSGSDLPTALLVSSVIDATEAVDYEWGAPARGVLRTYFRAPTTVSMSTAEAAEATLFTLKNAANETLHYRPDPARYGKHQIVPARVDSDTEASELPRDLVISGSNARFEDNSEGAMVARDVRVGDVLSVHEERLFYGSKALRAAIKTVAGSSQITAPASAGDLFSESMLGSLVFLDQGSDKGCYRIAKFLDAKSVLLDTPLYSSTPTILAEGLGASWGAVGDSNVLVAASGDLSSYVNKWLTLFGVDYRYQGSYKIKQTSVGGDIKAVALEGAVAWPAGGSGARWVITGAPTVAPSAVDSGTELYGLRAIRVYSGVPTDVVVTAVSTEVSPDASTDQLTFSGTIADGFDQPYRVYRKNLRRITSSDMSIKKDGPLYYFDTEVVSLEPQVAANISRGSYLQMQEGTYTSLGYRHRVADPAYTYSTQEEGVVVVSKSLLPVGSADTPANYLSLYGVPLQISYERADVVSAVQDFIGAGKDRISAANMLARHFLPAFVSYEATYSGGSAPSVIAKDIYQHIDTLPVENEIDVSEIEELIIRRGGNPRTPTRIVVLTHDWDRRVWVEFSEDALGGTSMKVPYNGTPRVAYFVPGQDVSAQEVVPDGERILLTQS